MGSAVINDGLIELEGNCYEINLYVVKENFKDRPFGFAFSVELLDRFQ